MRARFLLLAACWSLGIGLCGAAARIHLLDAALQVAAPRFAEGDVDGDGRSDLIVGGRVGPFRSLTDPPSARTARVELYAVGNGPMRLLAACDELPVVNDVAAGDLNGDGRDEIVAIGDHRLYVLVRSGGELVVEHAEERALGRLLRVDAADLDGDGRAEIAVAESRPETGAEATAADIHIYRYVAGLREEAVVVSGRHIGDLCFGDYDGDGGVDLAFEEGGEEIGGQISVYGFSGLHAIARIRQEVTEGRVRALSLAALGRERSTLLGVGDVTRRVHLLRDGGGELVPAAPWELLHGAGFPHGLHLTRLFDPTGLQAMAGTALPGAGSAQLWVMDRPAF